MSAQPDDQLNPRQHARSPDEERIRDELIQLGSAHFRKYARFIVAALSAIPWVGSVVGASASMHAEADQGRVNALLQQWLEEHRRRMDELQSALAQIILRVEQIASDGVQERIASDEYLALVRQGFRTWDQTESPQKRILLQRLLAHAATTQITSDEVLRLFIDWIGSYSELHFAVIRELREHPGSTRADIWDGIHGAEVREDSAEADLYRLLIGDLSLGRVIRQVRDTDELGRFKRKAPTRTRVASRVYESAFEDTKCYVLTALGDQFIHYVLTDVVPRIGSDSQK